MKILIGVTGSIAAYKVPELVKQLRESSHEVKVVVTNSGLRFVTPLTLEVCSNNKVYLDNNEQDSPMEHINLAKWADKVLISPATANIIAKIACGIADDLLTTTCLATRAPLSIAPAMNQQMWLHCATKENISQLKRRGVEIIDPAIGLQACGDYGPGRMAETINIVKAVTTLPCSIQSVSHSSIPSFYQKLHVVITAGPTREYLDPVRYLSNKSSGRIGYALAEAFFREEAKVTLISGPVAIQPPIGVKVVKVETALEMLEQVERVIRQTDIFVSTAAVSDYRFAKQSSSKMKREKKREKEREKEPLTLDLVANPDILATVANRASAPFTVGFAAETNNVVEYARNKLERKNIDMICANDVSEKGLGFDSEDNRLVVITQQETTYLEKAKRTVLAKKLVDLIRATISEAIY